MVYPGSPRMSYTPAPPVGSPDRDPEKEYLSHEEWLDEYYDRMVDRLNDEKCDRAEREENRK